jgi:periplasmic divalent cation tolerance protein
VNARVTEVTTRKGIAVARKVDAVVVLTMCKSKSDAKRIVTSLVEKRLAACGNILDWRATSIYRWEGKIERANEHLVILKSTRNLFSALEKEVTRLHSYDVPEIIALPIAQGSEKYLSWLEANVGPK